MIKTNHPTILQALIPIIVLIILIATNVMFIPNDTLAGANQLSLLIASAFAVGIAMYNGVKWNEIMDSVTHTIASTTSSMLILLIIGMLSGAWMISGIVPTMIYYGLSILSADYFLPAAIILSAIISVAVGSSWSTVATVGVALIGIGRALGFEDPIVAGAIISGAYFGDKVSPLSDTTNLASAITKTPLFTHIRYMMQTTIPTFLISVLIFVVLSFTSHTTALEQSSTEIQDVLSSFFNISPWLLIVPAIVILLIVKKVPAIIVLFTGSILGVVAALIMQPHIITSLAAENHLTFTGVYKVLSRALYSSTALVTGDGAVDALLSTGGMAGMLNTVWLIMSAMIFGGVLEAGQFLEKIVQVVSRKVHTTGAAVTSIAGLSIMFNVTTGDQYMAIAIPGKMFSKLFVKLRLKPELLSRTLEDAGTATSVLIPWNTCGATQASILGVATLAYAPWAFFCYLSPLMTILFAWFNIKIERLDDGEPIRNNLETYEKSDFINS